MISATAIALVSAQIISEPTSIWLTAGGSTIIGVGLWVSKRAQQTNWRARFFRRRALLADSVGYGEALAEGLDLAAEDLSDQRVWSSLSADRPARYYASSAAVGLGRLRENLVESAVWTEKLYLAAKARLTIASVLTLLVACGMASGVIFISSGALDAAAALQLLSVVLVFVISAEQFGTIDRWRWAAAETRRIRHAISSIRTSDDAKDSARIWAAFADYAVVTSLAPAIPRWLYKRHRDQLGMLAAAASGGEPKRDLG